MTYKKLLPALVVIGALALLGCSVGSSDAVAGDSSGTEVQIVVDLPTLIRSMAAPSPTTDGAVTWAQVIAQKSGKTIASSGLEKDVVDHKWRCRLTIDEADEGVTTFYAAAGYGAGYSSSGIWLYSGSTSANTGSGGATSITITTTEIGQMEIPAWTAKETDIGSTNAKIAVVPNHSHEVKVYFLARLPAGGIPTANAIINEGNLAAAGTCVCTGLNQGTSYMLDCVAMDTEETSAVTSIPFTTSTSLSNIVYNLNTAPGAEWSVGGFNCDWQWGTVTNMGPVGAVCYGTNISGYYGNDRTYSANYVQLGPLDFSGFTTAAGFRMTFDAYFHLDSGADFAQLQYSTNGTTFNPVLASSISGYPYTGFDNWSPNPVASDPVHKPKWRGVLVDLGTRGLNGATTVYFRWALKSDTYYEDFECPGFYIDNINIGY